MHAPDFDLQRYLDRIGFSGPARADLDTLQRMMQAQLCSVPFENLDVQAGKIVSLEPAHIVEKIVERRRGGYCYEVNGLFSMALTVLGIPHTYVAARPMFYPVRRPKTHMAIIAEVGDEQYLCDLGFGSYGIRAPLPLDSAGGEVEQGSDRFRLSERGGEYLLQAWVEGEWASQYGFDLHPQEWIDFMPANYLNSTHPEAVFVQKLLVVRFTPRGRVILFGDNLKIVEDGQVATRPVLPEERAALLREYFDLPARG